MADTQVSIGRLQESVGMAQVTDRDADYLRTAARSILGAEEVCQACKQALLDHSSDHRYRPARVVPVR